MELHDRLRALREGAGLSQADLARKIGVSRQAVWNIENGGGVSRETQERWVEACGLQVDFTLVGEAVAVKDALTVLDDAGRAVLLRWARLWPHLPGAAKRALAGQATEWERDLLQEDQPGKSGVHQNVDRRPKDAVVQRWLTREPPMNHRPALAAWTLHRRACRRCAAWYDSDTGQLAPCATGEILHTQHTLELQDHQRKRGGARAHAR